MASESVLAAIIQQTTQAVAARKQARPLHQFRDRLAPSGTSLISALRQTSCGYILECKKASPSRGIIRPDYDPAALARQYAEVASGISVLTDTPFFQGALDHLRAVRAAVTLPILCKDFIIDPYQIYEARDAGADAVLLLVSVLGQQELVALMQLAHSLQMDALVEVHDEGECDRALEAGARLIGINNRDLKTLTTSLEVTERLAPRIPPEVLLISESGMGTRADILRLRAKVNGFLIGTRLMSAAHVGRAARELVYGRVKVCGLRRAEDAACAWQCGALWGGLIFAPESPRCISLAQAMPLRDAAPLSWAGVFVNAEAERVAHTAQELGLSAVQLHGEESVAEMQALRAVLAARCEIWKGVGVQTQLPAYGPPPPDRVLLDAGRAGQRGGTGQTFDWSLIEGSAQRERLILAGGLRPETIERAAALGTWALDVNSGVEDSPGEKSGTKLRALFARLRGDGRSGDSRRGDQGRADG